MRRFGRALVPALCLLFIAANACAQAPYPSKPIRILVPYAPGGLTDVVARLYSEQLRHRLGRGVFIDNKPGASGIIAIEEMARARPDGHTLMIGNISTNGLTPILLAKKMKIDYERDVQIITPLADVPVFFLATTTNFQPDHLRRFPGLCQGASAQGAIRQCRDRQLSADQHRDPCQASRSRPRAHSVQRRRRRDHPRSRQRRHPGVMVQHHQSGRDDEGWPRARARHRGRATAGAASRRPHPRGGRLSRHPRVAMGGCVCAGGCRADIVETLRHAFVQAMAVPDMRDAFERGGMVVPPQASLDDPRGWLRNEMTSWKRDVEDVGIVVEE